MHKRQASVILPTRRAKKVAGYTKSVCLKQEWIISMEMGRGFLLWARLEPGVKSNVSCFYTGILNHSRTKLSDWAARPAGARWLLLGRNVLN